MTPHTEDGGIPDTWLALDPQQTSQLAEVRATLRWLVGLISNDNPKAETVEIRKASLLPILADMIACLPPVDEAENAETVHVQLKRGRAH